MPQPSAAASRLSRLWNLRGSRSYRERRQPRRVTGVKALSGLRLRELLEQAPEDLQKRVFTHSSWCEQRSDSYERLAFLGDSVLSLAITSHIYPRLDEDSFGAGRLTKIRAQTVSGATCRIVAERLELPQKLLENAPADQLEYAEQLVATERVLASVIEAVIGACYLVHGYDVTAAAVVETFADEIDIAIEHPIDSKSALQELLAQNGDTVEYVVVSEVGAPHEKTFDVDAIVAGKQLGRGSGRSKKSAEQEAAGEALKKIEERVAS